MLTEELIYNIKLSLDTGNPKHAYKALEVYNAIKQMSTDPKRPRVPEPYEEWDFPDPKRQRVLEPYEERDFMDDDDDPMDVEPQRKIPLFSRKRKRAEFEEYSDSDDSDDDDDDKNVKRRKVLIQRINSTKSQLLFYQQQHDFLFTKEKLKEKIEHNENLKKNEDLHRNLNRELRMLYKELKFERQIREFEKRYKKMGDEMDIDQ